MAIIAVVIGLAVGSFLNVVIGRLRSGETGWRSRSRCPHCGTTLAPRDLVPILSFMALGGKCRTCRKPISWQYPFVEAATALLFLAAYMLHGSSWLLLARDWTFIAALIVIFVIDLRDMVVFDSVTLPMIPIAFLFNLSLGSEAANLLFAALMGAGFFLLQYVISKGKWIGGGDIRIGAMMGAMLGFPGVIAALFLAYILGAAVAVPLLAMKKNTWSSQLAFGTFLTCATMIILFFGDAVWNWYAGLLGF